MLALLLRLAGRGMADEVLLPDASTPDPLVSHTAPNMPACLWFRLYLFTCPHMSRPRLQLQACTMQGIPPCI